MCVCQALQAPLRRVARICQLARLCNAVDLTYRLRVELRTGLADLRTELVRWMFAFWIITLIGIAGLLIALRRWVPVLID